MEPRKRGRIKDSNLPHDFNKRVLNILPFKRFSTSYVTMVRKGKRKNDDVLLAIITVDHYWNQRSNR